MGKKHMHKDDVEAGGRVQGSVRIALLEKAPFVPTGMLCVLLFLSGCTTYDSQVKEVRTHYLA